MPTLPDVSALGGLPTGQGRRAGANYGSPAFARPVDPIEPPRPVKIENPSVDTGAGLRSVGEGLQRSATSAAYFFGHEAAMQARLSEAQSDATFITESSKLKQELAQSNSVEEIAALKQRIAQMPDAATANLPEEQREYFRLKQAGRIADLDAFANTRVYTINKNNEIGAVNTKLQELAEAYKTGDNDTRAYAMETAGLLYEQLGAAGYYDQETINKERNEWSQKAVKGQTEMLPPRERIVALGGSLPGTVAAGELPAIAKAFLNGVSSPESAGKYNVRYTPSGGAEFSGFADHPRIYEPTRDGRKSSAAGRYQFVAETWDKVVPGELKAGGFTPENQDRAAWWLAQHDYQAKTGRNLAADLQSEGLSKRIMSSLGGTWEAWQSEAGQRKSMSAFNATMTGMPDVGAAMDGGDRFANVLPAETRLQMLQKAIADDARITAEERAKVSALNQDLKVDLDMVATSGIPLDGFRERYQSIYGTDGVNRLDQMREAAGTLFTVTSNMKTAPAAQLDMLAEQIRPAPEMLGSPIYEQLDANYKSAIKAAESIKKARADDIAAYADTLIDPTVREQAASGDIEGRKNLATARLRTQEQLGVAPEAQIPVTKQEARELMAPVTLALPGQERRVLQEVVPRIREIYGDEMTERVIGFALNTARVEQSTQEQAARVFKKLGMGQPVNDTEIAALDTARANDAMAAAAAAPPTPPVIDPRPDFGRSTTPEGEAVAAEIARQNQPQFPMPSDEAMRDLISQPTPGRIKAFNRTFGPNAADRVLGATKQTVPGRLP